MLWLIFATAFNDGRRQLFRFVHDAWRGVQIVLISALGALGVKRIGAVSSRIRRYQVD